jgi:hypothetical protein
LHPKEVYLGYLSSMFANYGLCVPQLLYSYQFLNFDSFLFYESKNFESIQRDYFKILFRPVTQEEL